MKKTLILASLCLCAGSLTVTGTAWAKKNSICKKDADVVLSKKFPHFDFDADSIGCARNDDGDCDPDSPVFFDDGNGLIYVGTEVSGVGLEGLIIEGTNRKNIIHGSSGDDIICGGNGKDEIWGEAGDDMIYGDNGKDSLFGGLGNDDLYGGNGKDVLSGYDNDNDGLTGIIAGEDDDTLYGEKGKDELTGGPGDDFLSGGKGKDSLDGGDGDDDVEGGKGKDSCVDNDDEFFIDDVDENECEATELEDNKKKNK